MMKRPMMKKNMINKIFQLTKVLFNLGRERKRKRMIRYEGAMRGGKLLRLNKRGTRMFKRESSKCNANNRRRSNSNSVNFWRREE